MDDAGPSVPAGTDPDPEDPTGRLAAYVARTQRPLDLLALLTLWIVVVPIVDLGGQRDMRAFGLSIRVVLSLIYVLDMVIRSRLATNHWRYLRTHPLGLIAALVPPVRVLFSMRLVREIFRRGNLGRFLLAALILLLNGAIVVYLYERDAVGANITSLSVSLWWSVVTVATVGYGDYYPVTLQGRVTAALIMAIGILTVAVITAQVASSFVDQRSRGRATGLGPGDEDAVGPAEPSEVATGASRVETTAPASPVTLEELDERLARIEAILRELRPSEP